MVHGIFAGSWYKFESEEDKHYWLTKVCEITGIPYETTNLVGHPYKDMVLLSWNGHQLQGRKDMTFFRPVWNRALAPAERAQIYRKR